MRSIGFIDTESDARKFGDYLYTLNIGNSIDKSDDNRWEVWILSDDDIPKSKKLLSEYSSSPNDPKYQNVAAKADELKQKEITSEETYRKKYFDRNKISGSRFRILSVTGMLIAISTLISLTSKFGNNHNIVDVFSITPFWFIEELPVPLTEIWTKQIWRLVTPIFIHFGFIHLLFNMLWLMDLGSVIEKKRGRLAFILLVLTTAVTSNIGQYIVSGPYFGGMSGVVYGLLGYVWMKGKFDPFSGLAVRKDTVLWMIAWFFICLSGAIGHVANTAHGVGLIVGMACGYLSAILSSSGKK